MAQKPRKKKVGRPPKPAGKKCINPVRQVGRWPDEDWDKIRDAAAAAGSNVAAWARPILLRAAGLQRRD